MVVWSKYPEIDKELEFVEEYVVKSVHSRNKLLAQVSRELVEAGGKRMRPALAVICANFGKYDRKKVLPVASAFEILHTATLVHDDIIDRSKLRRGKVTVSEKYGMDMAVYTGDFLYTKAILMLAKTLPAERLEVVARDVKSICEGEVDQYRDRYDVNTSVFSYLKRISRKTAALFSSACGLGAFASNCSASNVKLFERIGFCYGMAFQIRDDISDFISDAKQSGKPVAKDLMEGVITLPFICAMEENLTLKERLTALMDKKRRLTVDETAELVELTKENNGIEKAGAMLERYIRRGLKETGRLPANKYRSVLQELLENLRV